MHSYSNAYINRAGLAGLPIEPSRRRLRLAPLDRPALVWHTVIAVPWYPYRPPQIFPLRAAARGVTSLVMVCCPCRGRSLRASLPCTHAERWFVGGCEQEVEYGGASEALPELREGEEEQHGSCLQRAFSIAGDTSVQPE